MKKLMNILMLSCKKASQLVEKKLIFGLNPFEQARLYMHIGMCDACRSWQKQSKDLDVMLSQQQKTHRAYPSDLSEEKKEEILRKLSDLK